MTPCTACGGSVDGLGYCGSCGVLAAPPAVPSSGRGSGSGDPRSGSPASPRRSSSIGGLRDTLAVGAGESDPYDRLLVDPAQPERRRRCRNPKCRQRVGRSTPRRPGLVDGFCRECGWGFSFRPPLQPDPETGAVVVVAGRYQVLGAIGRGGQGWVYLAHDEKIPRHVVLKGLLDPDDPRTRSIALDELRALARTSHPNIVSVHDVVQHAHRLPRPGGDAVLDYIVMEYIHGESLAERCRNRVGGAAHLPISEAAASLLPAMSAVTHLHQRGLIHNDIKPDNVMVAESGRVFVVDLGAVSPAGGAPGFGTVGYRDPAGRSPSPQTDVYALGRTLAALTFPVPALAEESPLPGPEDVPLLAEHESFDLLLRRATHPDPERRFVTVEEFADQLRAVVREVESLDGAERPGLSDVFGPELRCVGTTGFPAVPAQRADWALSLPGPQVDPDDPRARRLAALRAAGPQELLSAAEALPDGTRETCLLAARARVELLAADVVAAGLDPSHPSPLAEEPSWERGAAALSRGDAATAKAAFSMIGGTRPVDPGLRRAAAVCARYVALVADLHDLEDADPDDVRALWLRGVAAVVIGAVCTATGCFAEVRARVPGEAAPRLALGLCAELRGEPEDAVDAYRTVWRTDRAYVSAAFGLARTLVAAGDRSGAIAVLQEVPHSSRYSGEAALGALAVAEPVAATDPGLAPGYFAGAARLDERHVDHLALDDVGRQEAIIAALRVAREWLHRDRPWPADAVEGPPDHLLGVALDDRGLRDGVERAQRRLAARAPDRAGRTAWIDRANRERNWSIW